MLPADRAIDTSLPPLLYAAIACEGVMVADAVASELASGSRGPLRAVTLRVLRGGDPRITFASIDSRARGTIASNDGLKLPPSVTVHVLRHSGHTFAVASTTPFEADLANRFCKEACDAYAFVVSERARRGESEEPQRLLGAAGAASRPRSWRRRLSGSFRWASASASEDDRASAEESDPSQSHFAPNLANLLSAHAKPERLARLRRLASLTAATDEVSVLMQENIDRVLERGQDLDALADHSESLLAQASVFRKQTRSLRRVVCCMSIKMSCFIGLLIVLLCGGLVFGVLFYLGDWPFPPPRAHAPPPPPSAPNSSTF